MPRNEGSSCRYRGRDRAANRAARSGRSGQTPPKTTDQSLSKGKEATFCWVQHGQEGFGGLQPPSEAALLWTGHPWQPQPSLQHKPGQLCSAAPRPQRSIRLPLEKAEIASSYPGTMHRSLLRREQESPSWCWWMVKGGFLRAACRPWGFMR